MCGIAGFVDSVAATSRDDLLRIVSRMSGRLIHRGPDDGGAWGDAAVGVALGHRRLAVIDLSAEGRQPMQSADGRHIIVFNGEIYNFAELRRQLEASGHRFRGTSDTEVLLAGIGHWGLDQTLTKSVGMFALALWDRAERALSLARDRMGEKPLYYGWQNGVFLFGSDLSALRVHPSCDGEIDRDATALLMRYGYVPAPFSIYRGLRKLEAGTRLTLNQRQLAAREPVEAEPYWSLAECVAAGRDTPFDGTDAEAIDALDTALRESVRLQMVADVPLGAFLSGGVDSSTVVALMQAQSTRPVKTFSIGFHEPEYNEAPHAAAVARHLQTDHTELYVSAGEAMTVIPSLADIYSEPFADPSQIPTCLVSRLARRQVTVSLSGDGGDELFCGYERYDRAALLWAQLSRMPRIARAGVGALILAMPRPLLDLAARVYHPTGTDVVPTDWEPIGRLLRQSDRALYQFVASTWREPRALVLGGGEPAHAFTDDEAWDGLPDFHRRMMYVDGVAYLPDDILVKVDRAAMAVSLETRVPLLDHRVVELAWRLPTSLHRRDGRGKWPLRQILERYVPRPLVERPKMGFGVPVGSWLRGPLRDWAEALLAPSRLAHEGYLAPSLVRMKWSEHLSGTADHQYPLWNVLMFQSWLERSRLSLPAPLVSPAVT
jgi:asparagine synthase (glutamine-hydrolysing)